MRPFDEIDRRAVTALRMLAVDQVEQAHSGHPGLPLGAAPMAYVLWSRLLHHDPEDPAWPDRDRFVLSAGHGSALLYALLHLFGYDLPLDELKRFRQWESRTPGHPEYGLTPGVEVTTGPLGQGFAAAVGMALAERHLAARFNREGLPLVDHRTWVIASDGDLMEGISHEAASLAGHLRLGRLAVLYDDNHITIEGSTDLAFSEDVGKRFAGYGWRVLHLEDGNDLDGLARILRRAARTEDRPTLVRIRTHIGWGSPKQDTAEVHGSPLGKDAAEATRRTLGWPIEEPFVIPDDIRDHFRTMAATGRRKHRRWTKLLAAYREAFPAQAAEWERRLAGQLPEGWDSALPEFQDGASVATRKASGETINAIAAKVPELLGGAGDLAPSTDTLIAEEASVGPGLFAGRNLHFGVREHAMAGLANGLALHGGMRPFVATFLIFSDYLRPALRLAALMGLPVIYVFTHDSIGLGEDGPTHQPIEHYAALRAIPNMVVLRPADARETVQAWRVALQRCDGPTALLLTRQKLPVLPAPPADGVQRGAFVRAEAGGGAPEVVLIATGSEVSLVLAAREKLEQAGTATRVVSAPSLELFAKQPAAYRESVVGPRHGLRVAVETGRAQGWQRWVRDGEIIALDRFGASAPQADVMKGLGYSVEGVVARVNDAFAARRTARFRAAVPAAIRERAEANRGRLLEAARRIGARDSSLWGERFATVAARRMGWLDLPGRTPEILPELERLVGALAGAGARTLYHLGMGGSSLAPSMLHAIGGNPSGRELVVIDTTDPERVADALADLDSRRAAVVAVSKSGTTAETSALLEIFWQRLRRDLGESAGARFLAVTEPGTPLAQLGRDRGFRAVLLHPEDVGGRYSALSVVGALPAVWLGLDVERLLEAGRRALEQVGDGHLAVELALLLASVADQGWGKLAWAGSESLSSLGTWTEQLVAESTGKEGHGIMPTVLNRVPEIALGWHGTVYLSPRFADDDTQALDHALAGVEAAGHPAVRWDLRRESLGEAVVTLELATAMTGLLIGVNPFDEPDVVRAKDRARAALAAGKAATPEPTSDPAAKLRSHLAGLSQDDVVVLLAYLPERPEVAAALQELVQLLAARLRLPVTAAFGPRYLHSTGQLHKGGPDHIVPVLLTGESATDVAIPGQAHTLGQLRWAQAVGDAQALTEVGRKVLHLHFGRDALAALHHLRTAW